MKKIILITIMMILLSSFAFGVLLDDQFVYYSNDNSNTTGSIAIDLAKNLNGTIGNATTNITGIIRESYYFDGDYDSIELNNFQLLQDEFTINFWVKVNSTQNAPETFATFVQQQNKGLSEKLIAITYNKGTNILYFYVGTGGAWDTALSYTIDLEDDTWRMLTFVYNFSGGFKKIYIDQQNIANQTVGLADYGNNAVDMFLMSRRGNTEEVTGVMDEFGIWNRSLTLTEVQDLYNNSKGYNPYYPLQPPLDSVFKWYFVNESNKFNLSANKTLFDEGEDFYTYLNWTYNNTQINGSCNITFEYGITPNELNNTNITLCTDIGCTGSPYIENITTESNISVSKDILHFDVCHVQNANNNLFVNLSCGNNSFEYTIDKLNFVTCSLGSTPIFLDYGICINYTNVTVKFSNTAAQLQKGHRITNADLDREYMNHTNVFGTDVFINSTTGLYYITHDIEYYENGIKNVYADCSNTTITKSGSTTITIVNQPPVITPDKLFTNCNTYNITGSDIYEYCDGDWNFLIVLTDNDIDTWTANLTCQNSSGTQVLVFNSSGNSTGLLNFTFDSSYFVDFVDPANNNITCIGSIFINDTGGLNDSFIENFTVVDIINPICLNINNASVDNGTAYNWSVQCYDEHFFSFNISCSGGSNFNFSELNINASSYNFINSTTITGNTTCFIEYCDGHTDKELTNIKNPKLNKDGMVFDVNNFEYQINYTGSYDFNFTYTKLFDRYSFNFVNIDGKTTKDDKLKNYHFKIKTKDGLYIPSNEFKAWIIDYNNRIWLDFNNDVNAEVVVQNQGKGIFDITVTTTENEIIFNSIGQLNCVNVTQFIGLNPVNLTINQTFQTAECPDTLNDSFLLWIIVFIILVIIFFGLYARTGFLVFLGALGLFVLSWVIIGCYVIYGEILIVISIGLLVWSLFIYPFMGKV